VIEEAPAVGVMTEVIIMVATDKDEEAAIGDPGEKKQF
jgi:hypothetical protein